MVKFVPWSSGTGVPAQTCCSCQWEPPCVPSYACNNKNKAALSSKFFVVVRQNPSVNNYFSDLSNFGNTIYKDNHCNDPMPCIRGQWHA